eukprot:3914922-Amphidinium_carterae.1
MRLRTGLTIRTGKRGTTPPQVRSTHNIQNNRFNTSGRTLCSSNHTMDLRSTVCMVWAHQPTVHSLRNMSAMLQQYRTQSPRHLRDFWAVIIDTGAAFSVCPMTFCEHIEVIPMGEDAKKQY